MTITDLPDTPADAGGDPARRDVVPTDGPVTVDLTDTDTDTGTAAPAAAALAVTEIGELVAVDPCVLVIGANVRGEVDLDPHFLRSITDRGVREPITARRAEDGRLVVRKGMRRTLAAVRAGRPFVPVLVEPGPPEVVADPNGADPNGADPSGTAPTGPAPGRKQDRAERATQIDRIVDQLEENHHRTDTSAADEVRAHQLLLDLGLTAGQIARRTHVPAARVKVTAAVARSELATAVLGRYAVTLDQAAVIAEFDDGTDTGVEAVKALTVTAAKEPGQFAHVTQKLRDQRAEAALVAAQVDQLTAAGVALVDVDEPGAARQISGLRASVEEPSGAELTTDAHATCPGHAAGVDVRPRWGHEPELRVRYWCLDPDAHGHVARWTQPAAGLGAGAGTAAGMSEEQKAERRRVIANNKQWDSATNVRRQWLRTFLARRTPPRDAAVFIAATLGRGGHPLRRAMESGHPTGCELVGLEPVGSVYTGRSTPIAEAAATATPQRATQLTLAVLLGAAEDATSRHTWREPDRDQRAYFIALRGWGYDLSPVEQLVLPDPTDVDPTDARVNTDDPGPAGTGGVDRSTAAVEDTSS